MPTQLTAAARKRVAHEVADLEIFADQRRASLDGEPLGLPVVDVAEAQRVRIGFYCP